MTKPDLTKDLNQLIDQYEALRHLYFTLEKRIKELEKTHAKTVVPKLVNPKG